MGHGGVGGRLQNLFSRHRGWALAKKCVFYSSSFPMTKQNCPTVMFELRYKGYPKAWWVNASKMGLKKFGLAGGNWREMHSWFREEHGRVA